MVGKNKQTIGRAEMITFPVLGTVQIPARVDTGAKTSAISAHTSLDNDGVLHVKFLVDEVEREMLFDQHKLTIVKSSNGIKQRRFVVTMQVQLAGQLIQASFTLADRSTQVYPVLIGRNVLRHRFIVDVSQKNAELSVRDQITKAIDKTVIDNNMNEDQS